MNTLCVNTLKLSPVIFLLLFVPVDAFAHVSLFSDDFNRPDNSTVGNGWVEIDSGVNSEVEILNNVLSFTGTESPTKQPCAVHNTNSSQPFPYLKISYTYNFAPIGGSDDDYLTHVRLGEDMICPDSNSKVINADSRIIDMAHGSLLSGMMESGGFGHIVGSVKAQKAIVNGTIDVAITANMVDRTMNYKISGPGFISGSSSVKDVSFFEPETTTIINSILFYNNKIDHNMPSSTIDNLQIIGLTSKQNVCGIDVVTDPINFGTVDNGFASPEHTIVIVGTGESDSLLSVYGTDWVDVPTGTQNLNNRENTAFSLVSSPYTSKTPLSNTDSSVFVGTVPHHGSLNTFWQTKLLINDVNYEGDIQQTKTFVVEC